MNLMETLTFLTVILSLLGLLVDVIRLTVEVMARMSRRNCDENKKD